MFKEVNPKVDFAAQERELLQFWKDTQAFQKLRHLHQGEPGWSFIDGPITANNPMGFHHGWGRTYKDVMQRFQSMLGHELRYQNGFDCQGLWVEVEVEKEKGFKGKQDIEDFGLEEFVRLCKARVLKYASIQTEQSIRLGYWMDWNDPAVLRGLAEKLLEDPLQTVTVAGPNGPVTDSVEMITGRLGLPELGGSYFTFSNENNYMIWAFLKKCWEKGWIYLGADVMPWCPHCATAISQMEIVTEGYSELTHRSVILRFPLLDENGQARRDAETGCPESLLVWTTTPWTLSSNVAAAVGPELTYARVQQDEQVFYLAKGTLGLIKGEYRLLGELKGAQMLGWKYAGPFDELPAEQAPGGNTHLQSLHTSVTINARQAHQVIPWDEVGETEGTGIVHIAPGCGAEDFQLGRQFGLPAVAPLNEEGYFIQGFDWLTGKHVSAVSEPIFAALKDKGILYRVANYTHRYPTCWRCKTELVFRLVDEWFISMGPVYDKPRSEITPEEKTHSLRYQIMDVVDRIKWIPDFGYAREMDWLRNMRDWMISKKRYWGLALPIWVCKECGHYEVIGSEEELKSRAVAGWDQFAGHTPHRPFVDRIRLACPQCGGAMQRVPDVGNPWLDAGIVPFSTLQYRADRPYWRKWYPANWITESFPGQFRNWFYSLLAMATVLDPGGAPFLENFGFATLLDENGQAMHKSGPNSIEFNAGADRIGVDVVRWLFCTSKPENDIWFGYHSGDAVRRQFLLPLWNVYSFFVMYANLDGWTPKFAFDPRAPEGPTPPSDNLLDRWALARLNQLVQRVTDGLNESDFYAAGTAVNLFIDDLTNWYVRRSRRRFWKSEQGADKAAAYATLYHILVKLGRLLAPFTPFVTEAMYQNLVRSVRPGAYESVHHTRWPEQDPSAVDDTLVAQMALARQVASLGLAARSSVNLKVRQPLGRAMAYVSSGEKASLIPELVEIIVDELNVKSFEFVEQAGRLVNYRVLPDSKALGPRFGAKFPRLRAVLAQADPEKLARAVNAGQPVTLVVDGETVELSPGEVLVQTAPLEGLAVATDHGLTVAVDATLTPELRHEGLAREFVRRVQDLRKSAGLDVADRIKVYYAATPKLDQAVRAFSAYVQAETLALELIAGAVPAGLPQVADNFEGEEVTVALERAA